MLPAALVSLPQRRARWPSLAAIVAAVALAHALILVRVPLSAGGGRQGGVPHTQQARPIVLLAAAPVALATERVGVALAPPAPPLAATPRLSSVALVESAARLAEPLRSPAEVAPVPVTETLLAAAPAAAPPVAAPGDGQALPVYRTLLPPPALLKYEAHRGAVRGTGEIAWRPAAQHYELTLDTTVLSVNALSWQSQGSFDAAGIAPDRFLDRRFHKSAQAANFQRAEGRITFSGPPVQFAIVPGVQDRLSFLLQLAAIVGADPARFGAGSRISMFVVGARGDGDVWSFDIEGVQALELPAGRVAAALHLHREPRRPYDMQVDVWLDPARAHMPVRLRLAVPQADESTDFLLVGYEAR